MATDNYEFSGKTVDEAVAEGLRALKLSADQVDVEVINKGSRGIFGLGSEPAQIRLRPRTKTLPPAPTLSAAPAITSALPSEATEPPRAKPEPPAAPSVVPSAQVAQKAPRPEPEDDELLMQPAADEDEPPVSDEEVETIAVQLLAQTVELMGFRASVETTWRTGNDDLSEQNDRYLLLDVQGNDLGALIGRRGEALENLQYLLRLMVNQRLRRWKNIVVDVEGYKERRVNQLKQVALRTATQVAATGRSVSLEPMPPNERRIIHLTFRDHPDVYTESSGEGERRKVHIFSKNH